MRDLSLSATKLVPMCSLILLLDKKPSLEIRRSETRQFMSLALPRVEQQYQDVFPELDVEADLDIVLTKELVSQAPSNSPLVNSRHDAPVESTPVALGVPNYLGGPPGVSRYLPLKHSNFSEPKPLQFSDQYRDLGFNDPGKPYEMQESYIREDASMSLYYPFSSSTSTDPLDLQGQITNMIRVEYDMDETDLGILGFLKAHFRVSLEPEVFEVVMSMLDFAAALLRLKIFPLERSTRDTPGGPSPDTRKCAVCNSAECTESNTIIFCDGCDVAVHQDCYGVHSIPEGRWLCRKCEASRGDDVRCIYCPRRSGAFKKTRDGHWAHLVCGLWIPELRVPEESAFLEPIEGMIDRNRNSLFCYLCRQKQSGACIQCAYGKCYTAFHATCAQMAGLYMPSFDHDIGEILRHQTYLPVYCDKHTPHDVAQTFPKPQLAVAREAFQNERIALSKRDESIFAKPMHSYWRTSTDTLVLPKAVVDAVHASIRERLNIELPIPELEFLCRYWTIKKDAQGGVMFDRRLKNALEIAERRSIRSEHAEEESHTTSELIGVVDELLSTLESNSSDNNNDKDPLPRKRPRKMSES